MTPSPARRGYLRFPAIHAGTVVFCCDDDLWSVPAAGGPARRLTAGVAEASRPRLSPDGEQIAFLGADDGPAEVYVMPAAGGPARRLTFQAARCVPVGWRPGGRDIVYASAAEQPAGFGFRLFEVPAAGGPARPLPLGAADSIAWGPDGAVVVGRNTADPARWKRYRGGLAGELWTGPAEDAPLRPLITLPGNLASPCWAAGRVFFISDHEGTGNVYSCRPDGTGLRRHTGHRDFYARGLCSDGSALAYHAGARLYVLDGPDAEPRPVDADLATDWAQRRRRLVSAAEYLEHAEVSPDGTRLAALCRGQAFTMAHWAGAVRCHGRADGTRYRLLTWLADGQRLAAVAAGQEPEERLVLLDAAGGPAETTLGESSPAAADRGRIIELAAAPDGGRVAFATSRQQLWTADAGDPAAPPRLVDASPFERIEDLAWSPDGRWLAYTYPDSPRTSIIKVASVAAGTTHAVTGRVLADSRPAFDPDGRYLYFLGRRELTPDYDQVQFGVGFAFGTRPYLVTLSAADPSPFDPRPVVPGQDPPARPGAGAGALDIDLDGIESRVTALPVPEGRYDVIVALPGQVLLRSVPVTAPDPAEPGSSPDGTVTMVSLAGGQVTEDYLSPADEISAGAAGSVLLQRCGSRLRVLTADGADDVPDRPLEPGPRAGWVDLSRIQATVQPAAEWRQMFREAWRLQRECFWDDGLSGAGWDEVYQRYAPLAGLVASRAELSDLIWELHGELGTSHAYERGGAYRDTPRHAQGFLGADWDRTPAAAGEGPPVWRIARLLHGDPWDPEATSPCRRLGAGIRPGDAVTAVNGQPVGPAGPGELLVGQAGREVELTVAAAGTAPRSVTVRAIGSEARARYRDWAERNRATVAALSGGRLGYLHVPSMTRAGYADFVRGFLAELDREGLIVDVRYNGGGNVSPLLLDRLARRRAGTEHGRHSGVAPYPAESPSGPMAALINEHTGSDGELFSHVFRVLGLGPLIGRRTWGGVIATWPRHQLVDGTITTQPEFRYYLSQVAGGLENHGVEPDLAVDNPPGPQPGDDRQLAAAVTCLLARLEPPAPAVNGHRAALDLTGAP
jgi:tricorn protease